jgi:hypothetical protein
MMHGSNVSRIVGATALLFLAAALGCGDPPAPPAPQPAPLAETGTLFDTASAGTVTGRVVWKGDLPSVQPLSSRPGLIATGSDDEAARIPNPNAPDIDRDTHVVRGAVVFLRGIDPRRGRPWDLPPVRVVQKGQRFHVRQGNDDSSVGFVRRGEAIEMVAADKTFYSLHAGGAAFFTLAFPDPDRPRTRRLPECGVVELTSGAGAFWMRGHLFVDDHPYYTRTDAEGRFRLPQVPPGRYEVVCWLPDWHEERHERDPETSLVIRVIFFPPLEWVHPVDVAPQGEAKVDFEAAIP